MTMKIPDNFLPRLDKLLIKAIEDYKAEVIKLNPLPSALVKAFYLTLELGESRQKKECFPIYSIES